MRAARSPLPLAAVVAGAVLCGCGTDLSSPISALGVAYSAKDSRYELALVHLNTLTSLRHLQGGAGTLRVGGSVRTSAAAARAKTATVNALRNQLVTAGPGDVDLVYNVVNGVVYPEGFDSEELLTAYFNLESARTTFLSWGLASIPIVPLVAHAAVGGDDAPSPAFDGELYYPPLATYYFPAPSPLAQVPISLNLGAVAHALGHQLVQQLAWGGAPVPPAEQQSAKDAAWATAQHVTRSMTEGLADVLGALASEDPRWFEHSLQQAAGARDMDGTRCSSPDMLQALPVDDAQVPYNPYPLGSVLSAAVWSVGKLAPQSTAKGLLAALPKIGQAAQSNGDQLSVALALDAIVSAAQATDQPALCGLFLSRFAKVSVQSLPSCSGVTPVPPGDACN